MLQCLISLWFVIIFVFALHAIKHTLPTTSVSYPTWAPVTKIPYTGWLTSSNNLFLTILEVGTSKITEWQILVSGEDHFLISGHLLGVSSHGRKDQGSHWGLFYKGTNPTHEGS